MYNVKSGILGFPDPVVSYRAFIQSGPRLTRGISNQEFVNATEELKVHYGRTINVRVARASKPTHIFIKKRCPVNLKSGQAKTCAQDPITKAATIVPVTNLYRPAFEGCF